MSGTESTGDNSKKDQPQAEGHRNSSNQDAHQRRNAAHYSERQERLVRLLRILIDPLGLIMAAMGVSLLVSENVANIIFGSIGLRGLGEAEAYRELQYFVGVLLFLAYYVRVMRAYLTEPKLDMRRNSSDASGVKFRSQQKDSCEDLEDSDDTLLDDYEREAVSSNVNAETIDLNKLSEKVLKNLEYKLHPEATKQQHIRNYQLRYNRLRMQISREMRNLQKRSVNNLLIGSVFSIMGMGVLGVFVLSPSFIEVKSDLAPTIASIEFLKRISVVIVIEVFGYFFLRLYRGNLEDIKYYQNEITNIDSRMIAIEGCKAFDAKSSLNHILKSMGDTERNFRLKKGESTIQLREREITNAEMNGFLAEIKSALAKMKKT